MPPLPSQERCKVFLVICIVFALAITWSADSTWKLLRPVEKRQKQYFDRLQLKTGDILLWSYGLHMRTDIEKLFCGSQYTHVSIVFMDRDGVPYAWETSGKTGNRLVRLEAELADPRYRCVVRPINRAIGSKLFETFVRMAYGGSYSFGFWKGVLFKWAPYLTVPVTAKKHMQAPRFCSELAAYTYERLGVMNFGLSERSHSQMLPGDFSEAGERCRPLPVSHGFTFGSEVRIKYRLLPYCPKI